MTWCERVRLIPEKNIFVRIIQYQQLYKLSAIKDSLQVKWPRKLFLSNQKWLLVFFKRIIVYELKTSFGNGQHDVHKDLIWNLKFPIYLHKKKHQLLLEALTFINPYLFLILISLQDTSVTLILSLLKEDLKLPTLRQLQFYAYLYTQFRHFIEFLTANCICCSFPSVTIDFHKNRNK